MYRFKKQYLLLLKLRIIDVSSYFIYFHQEDIANGKDLRNKIFLSLMLKRKIFIGERKQKITKIKLMINRKKVYLSYSQ